MLLAVVIGAMFSQMAAMKASNVHLPRSPSSASQTCKQHCDKQRSVQFNKNKILLPLGPLELELTNEEMYEFAIDKYKMGIILHKRLGSFDLFRIGGSYSHVNTVIYELDTIDINRIKTIELGSRFKSDLPMTESIEYKVLKTAFDTWKEVTANHQVDE